MQQQQYYEPVNVFRQPAIMRKTRGENAPDTQQLARTWQNNAKRIDYSTLRRVSDDYNDWYTTKKLQSDYWPATQLCRDTSSSSPTIPVDIAVNSHNDRLAVVTGADSCNKNLSLFQLDGGRRLSPDHKIRKLQRVSVPKAPITQVEFVEFHNPRHQGDLLLTAHQDGAVNLINTAADSSEIVRRYNHAKYMQYSDPMLAMQSTSLATPIRQLAMNTHSQNSFMSLINESLFFYDIDNGRTPTYLNHFPHINSFAQMHDGSSPLVSLAAATGLSFLDVREAEQPCSYNIGGAVLATEWLDQYTVAAATANSDTVKIFDLRMFQPHLAADANSSGNTPQIINPMSVCCLPAASNVRAMKYDQLNRKLFCLDDIGNLSNWDFDTKPCAKRVLKNGLRSLGNTASDALECGDMMVRGGDISSIALWKGAVVGLGHREVSVHRVIDITQSLKELAASNARATSAPQLVSRESKEEENVDEDLTMHSDNTTDTDATSVFDSTGEEERLDNATIKLVSMSPTKGSAINDSNFTLANLSCQTIVNTSTVA